MMVPREKFFNVAAIAANAGYTKEKVNLGGAINGPTPAGQEPAAVDEKTVRKLSFDEGRSGMLAFLDGFCRGNASAVFSNLERMKKEESVLPLLTALYNRIRPALYLALYPGKRGEWVKLVLQIKEYPRTKSREDLRHYPKEALSDLASGLLALSWKEKTSAAEGWFGFAALRVRCMDSAGKK